MDCVYKVWCEWDIGLNEVVFMTQDGAWEAATQGLQDMGENRDECEEHGLIGVERWDICE